MFSKFIDNFRRHNQGFLLESKIYTYYFLSSFLCETQNFKTLAIGSVVKHVFEG